MLEVPKVSFIALRENKRLAENGVEIKCIGGGGYNRLYVLNINGETLADFTTDEEKVQPF